MSKQRVIRDEMWLDEWFFELDPIEKLVWVFLLTNPRNNIAGIYQMSNRWGAIHTGLDIKPFETILERFVADKKLIREGKWVVITNFYRHQAQNPKVEQGICRILNDLPVEIASLYPIHSLSIDYSTLLNLTLLNLTPPNGEAEGGEGVKKN